MGRKKRAKQFFQKQTNRASKKCWEKIVAKCAKKGFFYSHEYRVENNGGKTRETIFPDTQHIVRDKNVGKKNVGKSAKKRFL